MRWFLVALACLALAVTPALAQNGDTKVALEFEYYSVTQSSADITEAAPIAVTNADKQSDAIHVGGGFGSVWRQGRLYLGVYYDIDCATTATTLIKVQCSRDGSTWIDCVPAESWTVSADEIGLRAISVPPCRYIRFYFTKDSGNAAFDVDELEVWVM